MDLKEAENLTNKLIASHEIILKENQEKKNNINKQIEKRTMQLFDHLFLNQIKLIKQNEQIESNLNLKSTELIDKLKHLIKQQNIEIEEIIDTLDEINQELSNLHYSYQFETDEKLENILSIGRLVSNF